MTGLYLTDRALSDISEVERYSVEAWGKEVADKYLDDLDAALGRLAENPTLFRTRQDYGGRLLFYGAREHVLIGDVLNKVSYVMTVWHGSMDFIDRLPEVEPCLIQEAEMLARGIESRGR